MNTIIAGRFETQDQGQQVLEALQRVGFQRDALALFYVAPHGQHDAFPVGGDQDESPGARDADKGAAAGGGAGAVAGAAVGLATVPLVGPAGLVAATAAGAYTGSLAGAMKKTNHESHADEEVAAADPVKVTERQAGVHVAVRIDSDENDPKTQAIRTLQQHGAVEVEYARGHIEDGNWSDFDPREAVTLV